MRPDDHHVEPFFAGLGHKAEEARGGRRRDPSIKWKLLAVLGALAALLWLVGSQAF